MAKVVAVSKDTDGTILLYKLDDGRVLNQLECAEAIHKGELPDLICTNTRSGSLSIRTYADGKQENNLSSLPLF